MKTFPIDSMTRRPEAPDPVREAARGFEALLLRQMLQAMQKAQLESGLFGKSAGSGTRQAAFDLMLTEALAETEPLGLAEQIQGELQERPEGDRKLLTESILDLSVQLPQVLPAQSDTDLETPRYAPDRGSTERRSHEGSGIGRHSETSADPSTR